MKVVLDKNFHIEPDSFNGVVLVETYKKTVKNKDGKEVERTYFDRRYYPDPVQAIKAWQKQTSAEVEVNISDLQKAWVEMDKKLGDIYHKFGEVNWFSKEVKN